MAAFSFTNLDINYESTVKVW